MPVMSQHDPFVRELMAALGLPKATVSFEIRCAVDEVVTVKCTYFPESPDGAGFDPRPLLRSYQLVPTGGTVRGEPDSGVPEIVSTGQVRFEQHINVEPREDLPDVIAAIRESNERSYASGATDADGLPDAPSVRGTVIGFVLFGLAIAAGVVTYTIGWWP